jgi:hypothetical protein
MISAETITTLEARGLLYILGVRERTDKLVREVVRSDAAPFVPLVIEKRGRDTDYGAKSVTLGGARTIVCINRQEAAKDAAERSAILAALQRQLRRGDKALVGNHESVYRTVGVCAIAGVHIAVPPVSAASAPVPAARSTRRRPNLMDCVGTPSLLWSLPSTAPR